MNKQDKIQMEKEIERQKEKVSKIVSSYWILAIIVGLFKLYGFKEKRITNALKSIIPEVNCLISGMIGMTDYMNSIYEEYGIDIKKIYAEIRGDIEE